MGALGGAQPRTARVKAGATHAEDERSGLSASRRGVPLALIIVRYFGYVLVAVALLLVGFWTTFSLMASSGLVYVANYADERAPDMVAALESGAVEPADVPSCYRWCVFDAEGRVLASDMADGDRAAAWTVVQDGSTVAGFDGLGGVRQQATAVLPNGNRCALQYDFVPDFTSRALRDALPDPQTLLIGAFFVLFVATVALIAVRAARVISRKMQPLAEAVAQIERQDLDFAVGSTNVREVNDVLRAMERMRAALADSLQARWAADDARRRQVSALAHDLKTPLAVARWNADLLHETAFDEDQRACVEDMSDSVRRMEGYVRLLVEASQAGDPAVASDVDVAVLVDEVRRQARQLCDAGGTALSFDATCSGAVRGDATSLVRAIANLVSNAVEHAPAGSEVSVTFDVTEGCLRMTVEDEGPGFSAAALERGKERFFTGSADRNAEAGHFGLGLSIVDDIAAAHGGSFEISNRSKGGARCVVKLPLA